MRLIDVGELMSAISEIKPVVEFDGPIEEVQVKGEKYEKVRHGKWVVAGNTTHYYICSVCGEPGDGWDNYCRSCGALMRGAEE